MRRVWSRATSPIGGISGFFSTVGSIVISSNPVYQDLGMVRTERIQIAFDAHRRISINCKMFQSGQNECGAFLMKITSITTVLILTFAGIALARD